MNWRLESLKEAIAQGRHHTFRQEALPDVLRECEALGLSWARRAARLTRRMCEAERPAILPAERIVFTQTLPAVPPIFSEAAWRQIGERGTLHEIGPINNLCPDWALLLAQGLLKRKALAVSARRRMAGDPEALEFLDAALETIDSVLALAGRYADAAREMGRQDIAQTLARVPARPARTFREGLQMIRFCHAILWLSGHYQIGLGRFDQYLWPYLQADLRARRLTRAEAEELVAEFFLSLNKDTDLYFGKRSNGQTLMLGGVRRDGRSGVNDLTFMALRAARDVGLVDPKINLRIGPDTDLELLSLASELTRQGLGFPQYSNDAVVIPALVNHGYEIGDARDYSVAACWEFIIPGKGMEVVNVGAVSFPAAVDQALRDGLSAGDGFDGVLARVRSNIQDLLRRIVDPYRRLILPPAPFLSVLMDGCVERGRDLSRGLKYNNFGVHGACSANAADALAAVRRFVFDEKSVAPDELLAALDSDFEGHEALRQKLCEQAPKVGNNDPAADDMLLLLFDALADACEAYGENGRGGIVRPGSGSAMYYLWLARGQAGMREPVVSATADGRKKGDFFSSSLSPSLNARVRGPLSMLQSFAKINYGRICNGGPITLSLSDTVFRGRDSLRKTGMLVRTFAQLGCQQLQVDVVSRDTLLAAKAHPERYRNLVVRVWGWSGYFCELDPVYQEHVIARHEFAMN